jgi:glycosyltransferase involved in cell wall biosynthesis
LASTTTLKVAPANPSTAAGAPAGLRRPRVLTFADYYLPGYRAGGTLRTLANMVDQLGSELHFRIVTRDRDMGDTSPYPGIRADTWVRVGNADVFYASPARLRSLSPGEVLAGTVPDVLYLNSFFSPGFTLRPLLLRYLRMRGIPAVVAPRGEFSPSALRLKRYKKLPYLALARALGVYSGVLWQVSSPEEEADLRAWFGPRAHVVLAPDLFGANETPVIPLPPKVRGTVRISFVGRISRMKNLVAALEALQHVRGRVEFTIYGPVADTTYWEHCRRRIRALPPTVRVNYAGPLPHEELPAALRRHHVFLLPSLGENFGHAIAEALIAGCPAIISDRTAWKGLGAQGAGWNVPLGDHEGLRAALQECVDMDGPRYAEMSHGARRFGLERSRNPGLLWSNRKLFRLALAGSHAATDAARHPPESVVDELRPSPSELS